MCFEILSRQEGRFRAGVCGLTRWAPSLDFLVTEFSCESYSFQIFSLKFEDLSVCMSATFLPLDIQCWNYMALL